MTLLNDTMVKDVVWRGRKFNLILHVICTCANFINE